MKKNISMWATLLCFLILAVVAGIDACHLDKLSVFIGVAAIWCIAGWYWQNRKDFVSDLRLLFSCHSPMDCNWVGTFIFMVFILLLIVVILIGLAYLFSAWLISLV